MKENESEFGDGCIYNLSLFIAHQYRTIPEIGGKYDISMWFHGAGDHMFGFYPDHLPEPLRERGSNLKDFILTRRDCLASEDIFKKGDVAYAIKEAKSILLEIDKLNGVPAIQAQWD